MLNPAWKPNWLETRQSFDAWWNHQGLIVGAWDPPKRNDPHEESRIVKDIDDITRYYSDPIYHAELQHSRLAQSYFGGDILPVAETDIGPGSLALYLGSDPGFARDTVWFNPCMKEIDQPIHFDPANHWWQVTYQTIKACVGKSEQKYLVGCPDLVENLDILASMRGVEALLIDLVDQPQAVLDRLEEINQAWFDIYSRIYDLTRLEDGSSTFGAFRLWGAGKTAKLQCDASAMLSPRMFRRFVIPGLRNQCSWLDHSMYHLDGHQCLCHLDALLEIEDLDAIEWTPDPAVPTGGDPEWYSLYRKIIDHGKSVQAVGVKTDEIIPLLEHVGPKGLYLFCDVPTQSEFEQIQELVRGYTRS